MSEVMAAPAVPLSKPLVVADRCEKKGCGAQALTVYMFGFSGLMFCGHHATENHAALVAQGFTLDQDTRGSVK